MQDDNQSPQTNINPEVQQPPVQMPTNVPINPIAPQMGGVTPPAPPVTPSPQKNSKLGLIIAVVVLVVLAGGAAAYFMMKEPAKKPVVSMNTTTDSESTKDTSSDTPKTITVEGKGTYELQDPLDTTMLLAQIQDKKTSKLSDDPLNSVTVTHPKDWEVYKKKTNAAGDPYNEVYIKSAKGHFLFIYNQGGVGGDCPPNTDSYTLLKKLSTKTPGLFFTQYDLSSYKPYFRLESFIVDHSLGGSQDASFTKHQTLKEGESNTDVCNIGAYPLALSYTMVTIKSDNKASVDDRLTWDQIKDDTEFVAMLQSLDVKKSE